MIIFLFGHHRVNYVLTCIVVRRHIWGTPFPTLLSKKISHEWLEALLNLVCLPFFPEASNLQKLWNTLT